jgi:hypothetical protein
MVDRVYGIKQSDFIQQTSVPAGSYMAVFNAGVNYKITYAAFLSGLGVTGTIVQDGAVTGTPVLDVSGTVNNIRNLEDGAGISCSVSAENGITIEHNFTVDTTGNELMLNPANASPTFVSLVAGAGMTLTSVGNTIQVINSSAVGITNGQCYMQANATATVIASTATPVLVAGTWTANLQVQATVSAAGRITYTGAETLIRRVEASVSLDPTSGANQDLSVYIAKNGTVIAATRMSSFVSNGAHRSMSVSWMLSMTTNDYVELFVQNSTAANNILVDRVIFGLR